MTTSRLYALDKVAYPMEYFLIIGGLALVGLIVFRAKPAKPPPAQVGRYISAPQDKSPKSKRIHRQKSKKFVCAIVGESLKNNDGSSRQEIIAKLKENEPLNLNFTTFRGKDAIAVERLNGACIGWIAADLAPRFVKEKAKGYLFKVRVSGIYGDGDRKNYGVWIEVTKTR